MRGCMTALFATSALLPTGWASDVRLETALDGTFASCTPNAPCGDAEFLAGSVVPGIPNLHSHAFQRAMAGLAERAGDGTDSFWSWREIMYGFVGRLDPEEVEAIAAQLYVEMLKAGYTSVGEFHYLHHQPDGRPYDDPCRMSEALLSAASRSGIGITLLPGLYQCGGFDARRPGTAQRRFVNSTDAFIDLYIDLSRRHGGNPQ